jgi:hypothetical protein
MRFPAPSVRLRATLVLTAVALFAAVLRPAPAIAAPTVLTIDDQTYALNLEALIPEQMANGQVYNVRFVNRNAFPGDTTIVPRLDNFADSALWTGTYLAAESFRYATAKRKIELGFNRKFWMAQKLEAKARIDQMVAKYHLLINISRNWDYEFNPSLDPPGFGGGVFHGEAGYLMRACAPTDAPWWQTWDRPHGPRVFGPLGWEDGKQYYCEDGTSRDAYAGTTFGLLTAFDLVSVDDPAMRKQIKEDISAMTSYTLTYAWTTPRPHGNLSLVDDLPPEIQELLPFDIFGHDFENFISPLFVYVPLARLNMALAALHVNKVAGTAQEKLIWHAVWAEELLTQGPILALSMEIDALQPNDAYYKFNLHHLTGYNVTRLAPDATSQLLVKQALSVMDHTTRDDNNAHFETITYALTGEASRLQDAVQHLREWKEYRANMQAGLDPLNSVRCGADIACVPKDRLDWEIGGPPTDPACMPPSCVTVYPGTSSDDPETSSDDRATLSLEVPDRTAEDFLWQRPPWKLDGHEATNYRAPGIDYLLPYWMLRYYTEIAPPPVAPFLPWPGPSHR